MTFGVVAGAVAGPLIGGLLGGGDSGGSSGTANQTVNGIQQAVGGALSGQEAINFGNRTAAAADPFAQYRGQFGQQLAQLGAGTSLDNNYKALQETNNTFSNQVATQLANVRGAGVDYSPQFAALGNSPLTQSRAGQYLAAGQSQQTPNALNGIDTQYANLLRDPNNIFQDKAYQAQLGQGQEAVSRQLAARGQTASGNELQALQNYGEGQAAQYYGNRLGQLSTGYGQQKTEDQRQFADNITGINGAESSDSRAFNSQLAALTGAQGANTQYVGQQQANINALQNSQNDYFNRANTSFAGQQRADDTQFNRLAALSGQAQGSPGDAARALGDIYKNVNSAYNNVGQGLARATPGVVNGLNSLFPGQNVENVNPYGDPRIDPYSGLSTAGFQPGVDQLTGSPYYQGSFVFPGYGGNTGTGSNTYNLSDGFYGLGNGGFDFGLAI